MSCHSPILLLFVRRMLCVICMLSRAWSLGVWGELASCKRLFNPPPQFLRLGTQGPALVLLCCLLLYVALCIVEMEVGISFYSFSDFLLAGMLKNNYMDECSEGD